MEKTVEPVLSAAALEAAFEALYEEDASPERLRPRLLAELRGRLGDMHAELRGRFESGTNGFDIARAASQGLDVLLEALYRFTTGRLFRASNPTAAEHLAIVAVGGYGRGELAPQSDLDLLFVLPYKQTPFGEQVVEYMLYVLWDLGLKVGHAVRSSDDCIRLAKADMTIRTAILESRFIAGDEALYEKMRGRFLQDVLAAATTEFVDAKLAERDARHRRLGDSRYVLEPNIKDGKGGLRDLHTLFWIAKAVYQIDDPDALVPLGVLTAHEATRFDRALRFFWNVRYHLHYLAGRAEERLTFDVQPEISRRMGYIDRGHVRGVERFMKHYFLVAKDVGDLTRIFCAYLETQQKRRPRFRFPWVSPARIGEFVIEGNRINVEREDAFAKDPLCMIKLFHVAQEKELDVHPYALRLITQNLKRIDHAMRESEEASRLFLEILTSKKDPERALRRMNEAGVLGRLLPEFGRIVAQMQYNMYHVHTVDEHSIFAVGTLHGIEQGRYLEAMPLSSEIVDKVLSRRVLYLAVLLHDIAKGRPGDHSIVGSEIADRVCRRLHLSEEETETVVWLVRYHLLMSGTAFQRDTNDPEAIKAFVDIVQSPERLRLLLLLTVADIRAVGPDVWNAWKASLLRALYFRAEEVMSGGLMTQVTEARVGAALKDLRTQLTDWTDENFDAFCNRGFAAYWLAYPAETLTRQARLMYDADKNATPLSVQTHVDAARDVTEVTIYTADHPGLFSRLAGALSVAGANIVDAKIFTMKNGMALDTFWLQSIGGKAFDKPKLTETLTRLIRETLAGEILPVQELARHAGLPSRTQVFTVAPRVLIDNKASHNFTVVEVNGRDRPGFLYDVTRALSSLHLQIGSAHITTYGERAVDVFYVKDIFGMKIEHGAKLKEIKERLLDAVEGQESLPPPARAAAGE
ncbi:MAG: [protein-PII] uridylyltransferase [Alphaproteobacteria bacterium]|nr:[protein-PII] uridylyltransferase [Alphaproteobacteria bacterium]